MRFLAFLVLLLLILGIWYPVLPFPVKKGYHGIGGEFCGIVYNPECDQIKVGFFTYHEINYIVANKYY